MNETETKILWQDEKTPPLYQAKVFPVDDSCIPVGEDDTLIAYWVTTSRYVWFVDKETGFALDYAFRQDTETNAIDFVKEMLAS